MPKFTAEQEMAITTRNCDLLVSAAAGSGKTAVLVERIIRMITNTENPVPINRLLVLTFTEAAAREMRTRLERALEAELEKNPSNRYIENQIVLLNKSFITTIHSFCLRIVRKYFSQAGVDPMFRVADTTEIDLMKTEVLSGLFEDLYNEENKPLFETLFGSPSNKDFLELVEIFGDKVKDGALQKLVLNVYYFSQSHPFPERFLNGQMQVRYEDLKDAECTEWYAFLKDEIKCVLETALNATQTAISRQKSCPYLPDKNALVLAEDLKNIQKALTALDKSFEAFYGVVGFKFNAFSGGKAKKCADGSFTDREIKELRESIRMLRDEFVKKPILELTEKIFVRPFELLLGDLNTQARLVRTLCAVTNAFSERFFNEKRQKNIADFNDFEHLCLKVLVSPESDMDNIIPNDTALELREYFIEVMIDEYQDSNAVQEMILKSVSRRNMFMVGDAKQSIYKFRLADPSIFMDKYAAFSLCENTPSSSEALITLSKNFRSRENVIEAVNKLFLYLMSEEFGEIEYDSRSMLYTGASYPEGGKEYDTEILLVDTGGSDEEDEEHDEVDETQQFLDGLSAIELEARLVAKRIRELLDSGFAVRGEGGAMRPVRHSDIAVLLRSPKASSEIFVAELKNRDIPAFSETAGGYFEASEVLSVLAFLQIIDNPLQDIPLLSVLYSPVYAFTSDELVEIKLSLRQGLFFNALRAYGHTGQNEPLKNRVNMFLEQLDSFREFASRKPISELIRHVYEQTGCYNFAGAMEGGAVRQANLSALFNRAVEYEKTSLKGLFHFIKYIEKIRAGDSDDGFGAAKVLNENADVVKIMSIHKSKGLEFPIVFVSGLARKFNQRDISANIVMHKRMGIASVFADIDKRVKSDCLPRYAISRRLKREGLSEELRVLYVALTRAKEKLILTGAFANIEKYLSCLPQTLSGINLPPYLIAQTSYMKWILPAVFNTEAESNGFNTAIFTKLDLAAAEPDAKPLLSELRSLDPNADYSGQKQAIYDRLSYTYPRKWSEIPSKLSVSEIKRRYDSHFLADSLQIPVDGESGRLSLKTPEFLSKDSALTAAQKGTVTHAVLERLPPDLPPDMDSLKAFLAELLRDGIFTEEQLKSIDVNGIYLFLNSEIYDTIKTADFVWREARFVVGINPTDAGFPQNAAGENPPEVLVHGIIDCMIERGGKITLIDYKTDRINGDINVHAARYNTQMKLYKLAAEKITKKPVDAAILFFLSTGEAVAAGVS